VRHTPRWIIGHECDKDFGDWISQGGGCDIRAVVPRTESVKPHHTERELHHRDRQVVLVLQRRHHTKASSLQIDRSVPVENAWISGAWRWTHATRVRYYNDLRDSRTLVAVDIHDNQSKGDQDPTTWLPTNGQCRYVRSSTAVKTRWHLNVLPRLLSAERRSP